MESNNTASYNLNLKRLFLIENIYIPILNSLHQWKPFDLKEFESVITIVSKLNIGIISVEFYNKKLQKYKPYNLEISRLSLKNSKEYNGIAARIERMNELYPEKITHLSIEFEIQNQILIDYKKTITKNQLDLMHNDFIENKLLNKLQNGNQESLKTLINIYRNEILHISMKYIEYNINPIQEGIIGFYNASRIYNKNQHGKFKPYIVNWMESFINQSVLESLRLT